MIRNVLAAAAAALGGVAFAGDLKSGPQAGEKVPGAFHPLNVNGEDAGKKACLFCKAGDSPTVAVFARSPNDPGVRKLIEELEIATLKYAAAELNAFVVFCSDADADKLEGRLKKLADKADLKNVVLSIDAAAGPEKYAISKDAEVTVLLYKERVVVANHTFTRDELTKQDVKKLTAEVAKLVK